MHEAITNILVIVFTGLFSYRGFADQRFEQKYIFQTASILAYKEYYRLITSGSFHRPNACNVLSLAPLIPSLEAKVLYLKVSVTA